MAVNNDAIKGSLVILKVGNGAEPTEAFTPIAGLRNVSFTLGGTQIDVTTADDIDPDGVTWLSEIAGIAEYRLTGSGVMKNAAPLVAVMNAKLQGTVANYQLEVKDKFTITGPCTVTDFNGSGEFADTAQYNITVSSAGIQTVAVAT